ncbi:hypothetical protein CLF_103955 [Clonorchis sinensis]|uniref:EF-hand domain-containing protein n=1 Tax=Clonorchis sinensis TaxID=79923 RepID=G7YAQ3_CLOSI|nr:hypothetical protein CLF_103955 [Clonorchis sinensis]
MVLMEKEVFHTWFTRTYSTQDTLMRKEIPEETIKQATDLFYSCEPVVDNQDGTLYLPISDIAKMQTSRSSVLANLNLRELETTFRLLDVNGDGKLTLEEFVDGFIQLGQEQFRGIGESYRPNRKLTLSTVDDANNPLTVLYLRTNQSINTQLPSSPLFKSSVIETWQLQLEYDKHAVFTADNDDDDFG